MPYSVTYKELVISGAKIVNCSHFFPMTLPEFMEKTGFVSYGYSRSVKLAVFCCWKAEVGGYFPLISEVLGFYRLCGLPLARFSQVLKRPSERRDLDN